MTLASNLSTVARHKGYPKVLSSGPSSLGSADRVARALGWFSIGLGLAELVAPRMLTRALGMEGHEGLVRGYGVREISAGVITLSASKQAGLWSRVAGDALDIATVLPAAASRRNSKRGAAGLALTMLAGVALIDLVAAKAVTARHAREWNGQRSYRDRSGFPRGLEASRGAASDFEAPSDMLETPVLAEVLITETAIGDGAGDAGPPGQDRS